MNLKEAIRILARWCYQWIRPRPNFYKKVKAIGVEPSDDSPRLIVSLTSFPARIKTVSYTIETILSQTKKPNEVILWLASEQFPLKEKELPNRLLRLRKYGLDIRWCEDIRSYKKLIPTLQLYPNDIIVTTDDDVYYPPHWLETLYGSYLKYPKCIHTHRALEVHSTLVMHENVRELRKSEPKASARIQPNGVGGVLYPPHCFYKDVCNEDKFMALAPTNDDIWFWVMALLEGYKCMPVKDSIFDFDGVFIVNNKTLCSINHMEGLNDLAMKAVFKEYPDAKRMIDEEPFLPL